MQHANSRNAAKAVVGNCIAKGGSNCCNNTPTHSNAPKMQTPSDNPQGRCHNLCVCEKCILEKSVQFGIHAVNYLAKVFRIFGKFASIYINNQYFAFVVALILVNPFFVSGV